MIERLQVWLIHWLGGLTPMEIEGDQQRLRCDLDHMQWAAREVLESRQPIDQRGMEAVSRFSLRALQRAHFETTEPRP